MGHYSQKDEDVYILRAVDERLGGRVGKFLDIGAYDGIQYSNTRVLVERGWTGVMVEPGLEAFQALLHNYRDNQRVALIHAPVSTEWELVDFWNNTRTFSTTHAANTARFHFEGFSPPYFMGAVDLDDVLRLGPFDVISLDTEGTSMRLLAYILSGEGPISIWRRRGLPSIICVEHDGAVDYCRKLASDRGYTEIMGNEENLIFAK